ncbi:MAG: cupredoxin domain-containing protein [Proteobacteria bacterium]|nr:cupredoxin domain-containing protein [Pseudomonadota bacterium]
MLPSSDEKSAAVHHEIPYTSGVQQATIYLQEYRFEPALTTLKAGQPARLVLINRGNTVHEFVTDALHGVVVTMKVQGTLAEMQGLSELEIPPGGKVVLRFTPEQTGEFAIACHASMPKDHFKQGMVGKLLIQ